MNKIRTAINNEGGAKILKTDCDHAVALNSNNHLPFLLDYYRGKRETLLKLLEILDLCSSTQDTTLLKSIKFILDNREEKSEYIAGKINLSFTTVAWQKLIIKIKNKKVLHHHYYLELCVLSHVANELRSKDLFITGADSFDDHRKELLPQSMCESLLADYCKKTNIPSSANECVRELKEKLEKKQNQLMKLIQRLRSLQ